MPAKTQTLRVAAVLSLAAVTAIIAITLALRESGENPERPVPPSNATKTAEAKSPVQDEPAATATSARRVHIDPATGEIVQPPAPQAAPIAQRHTRIAVSTSQTGLRERKSPVAGGGNIVDLQGRFQSTVSAKLDNTGAPCLICSSDDGSKACDHQTLDSEPASKASPKDE